MNYPGRIIKTGDTDAATLAVIAGALAAKGIQVPVAPARFDAAFAAAVKLFQAQRSDRFGRPLRVDGQVGPLTWGALFGAAAAPAPAGGIALAALQFAIGEIGTREVPPGSNRGPRVDQYLLASGVQPGNFWCMAFVYFCYREAASAAGIANPFPRTAHCQTAYNMVQAASPANIVTRAAAVANPGLIRPGMVFIHNYGGGRGHTGFVEATAGAALKTVEGNADPMGGSNGLEVLRVNRRSIMDTSLRGFIAF